MPKNLAAGTYPRGWQPEDPRSAIRLAIPGVNFGTPLLSISVRLADRARLRLFILNLALERAPWLDGCLATTGSNRGADHLFGDNRLSTSSYGCGSWRDLGGSNCRF